MTWRRTLVELSLRRMNMDRWVVVYLLVSGFYPFLRPGVSPEPWINVAVHAGMALAVWFIPPLLRCSRHFVCSCWEKFICRCSSLFSMARWNIWAWFFMILRTALIRP